MNREIPARFCERSRGKLSRPTHPPIKAGRSGHGKMKTGYFWPIYGEQDEVCFPFFPSRGSEHVRTALGLLGAGRVLLTDGYAKYEKYARKLGIAHPQCWVHCRRTFFEALQADPEAVEQALKQIAALYKIEDQIREQNLTCERKRQHRLTHSKSKVESFFEWIDRQFERQGLVPSSPFTQALSYARERRVGLEVFLEDPDVQMDTNHLERALRVIPMGRRNWLFTWTELGAKTHRYRAEPAHDLPPARDQPLRLPGRHSAARWEPPSFASLRTHPTAMEAPLRQQTSAL